MNWKFLIVISLVVTCFACKKDKDKDTEPIVQPINDHSLPAAAVLNMQVTEHTADHIKFTLNVAVFRDSKNLEDQLTGENFSIDSLTMYNGIAVFKNNKVELAGEGNATAYSAVMLMDQSGSISETDPKNQRLDAAHIFCANLGGGNNTSLWSFAGASNKKLTDFTTDTALLSAEIEKLRGREGGNTPLYDAQHDAVTYVNAAGSNTNKAVLAFTDGKDSGFGFTSGKVVTHAKDQGIKLYNIGLGDVSRSELLNQAIATQGAFMYAKDARQLISMFGNLGKLLNNTAAFYQAEWTITGAEGKALFTGVVSINHEMKITLPYGGEITVPFSIYLY